MVSSKVEHFISYYIFGELQNWSGLSGDDVVAMWLKNLCIDEID